MTRVHKAHELVGHLCAAWTDKYTAGVQAGIIVRELSRAGMLVGSELLGMIVTEVSGQTNSWWPAPAQATKPASMRHAGAVEDEVGSME